MGAGLHRSEVRRPGLDALQILGALRIRDVRRNRDERRVPPRHRVPQIRPRLRAWDAWGEGLLRIDRELLFRQGNAAPNLVVRLLVSDRKLVFRAATQFLSPDQELKER